MRFLLLLLGLLAAFPAWGSAKLKLTADRPVVIVVNMIPHPVGDSKPVTLELDNDETGTQRVMVRDLTGRQLYAGTVVVQPGTVVTVAWRNRLFEVVDREQLRTSVAFNNSKGAPKRKAGHRTLDGLAATEEPETDLLSLAAGSLGGGGAQGTTDTPADNDPDTSPAPEPAPTTSTGSGSSTAKGANTEKVLAKDLSNGATDTVQVKLVARSQSWSNVWVGDQKAWEYRGEGDALLLTLPAGAHLIAVKDFRDQDSWGSGTLTVTAGTTAEVYFSKSSPIETKGGSWAADTP